MFQQQRTPPGLLALQPDAALLHVVVALFLNHADDLPVIQHAGRLRQHGFFLQRPAEHDSQVDLRRFAQRVAPRHGFAGQLQQAELAQGFFRPVRALQQTGGGVAQALAQAGRFGIDQPRRHRFPG